MKRTDDIEAYLSKAVKDAVRDSLQTVQVPQQQQQVQQQLHAPPWAPSLFSRRSTFRQDSSWGTGDAEASKQMAPQLLPHQVAILDNNPEDDLYLCGGSPDVCDSDSSSVGTIFSLPLATVLAPPTTPQKGRTLQPIGTDDFETPPKAPELRGAQRHTKDQGVNNWADETEHETELILPESSEFEEIMQDEFVKVQGIRGWAWKRRHFLYARKVRTLRRRLGKLCVWPSPVRFVKRHGLLCSKWPATFRILAHDHFVMKKLLAKIAVHGLLGLGVNFFNAALARIAKDSGATWKFTADILMDPRSHK